MPAALSHHQTTAAVEKKAASPTGRLLSQLMLICICRTLPRLSTLCLSTPLRTHSLPCCAERKQGVALQSAPLSLCTLHVIACMAYMRDQDLHAPETNDDQLHAVVTVAATPCHIKECVTHRCLFSSGAGNSGNHLLPTTCCHMACTHLFVHRIPAAALVSLSLCSVSCFTDLRLLGRWLLLTALLSTCSCCTCTRCPIP
jgi:hypothetical protein